MASPINAALENTVVHRKIPVLWFVLAIALAVFCAAAWGGEHFIFNHPDESIATGVVPGMIKAHSWDTNWALYDIPYGFSYPQYNFSSYYAALSVTGRVIEWLGLPFALAQMKMASAAFFALSIVIAYLIGAVISGRVAGLITAAMCATCPQLYQDSLYARPDAFLTLISLVAAYLALQAKGRSRGHLFASSILVGTMIACKISAAPYAVMPLAVFYGRHQTSAVFKPIALALAGILAGMWIGAPGAFLNPRAYISGIRVLFSAYSLNSAGFSRSPTDMVGLTFMARLSYLLDYLIQIVGIPAIALAALGVWKAIQDRRFDVLLILFISVISIGRLGILGEFYERNFSHALPFLFLATGIGASVAIQRLRRNRLHAVAFFAVAVLCVLPASATTASMIEVIDGDFAAKVQTLQSQAISANPGLQYVSWPNLTYGDGYGSLRDYLAPMKPPFLLELWDMDDRWSQKSIDRFLIDYRAVEIGVLPSPFRGISTSSMQAYMAQTHRIYRVEAVN